MGRIITRQKMGTLDRHVEILVPRYIYQGCHSWETGGGDAFPQSLGDGGEYIIARLVDSFLVESCLHTVKVSVITAGILHGSSFEEFKSNLQGHWLSI